MRREKRDVSYLWDMLDAGRHAVGFVQGKTFEDYRSDRMLRMAVERCVEIVGEAARRVTREFRDQHPEIPWQPITAQRHVLAHDYDDIQDELIWRVATVHLPKLVEQLRPLVPEPPTLEE